MRLVAAAALAVLVCAGGSQASFPAPAGRILAVVETFGGTRLSLLNTNGTVVSEGPAVGIRSEGAVDASGTRVAFSETVSLPIGGLGRDSELILADLLGAFRTLTDNRSGEGRPSWARDGRRIAFASDRNRNWDVYVGAVAGTAPPINLTGGSPALDRNPRWSPDGRSIAFETDRDGNVEIYVMQADGSAPTNLTRNPAADRLGDWSPDGTRLVFSSDRAGTPDLYVHDLASGTSRVLAASPAADTHPAWSPDGRTIAFSSDRDGDAEIFLVQPDGANERRVTTNASEDLVQDWQPLHDRQPPVVRALPSASRRGGTVVLRFRIAENTRRAAVAYFLDLGGLGAGSVFAATQDPARYAPGRVYTLMVPSLSLVALPRSFRFCVAAVDPSANASRTSCARFRFRG
jgi:dipeptidyl aminopeptidase/acylaminoacyl peptidase